MDVHTSFLIINRHDGPYNDIDRRSLRASFKAPSPPSAPVADGVGCLQVPGGVVSFRQFELSNHMQELLNGTNNKRAVAAAATRPFVALQKGHTLRSIGHEQKLGKHAKTMNELGLEGWLGVEF